MTIAVIGAGASGMMAALTAAEQPENKIHDPGTDALLIHP